MNVGSQYRHLKPCINQVIFLFRDQRPNMEKVTSLGAWYSWVPTMKPLDSMDSPLWLNRIFFLVFIPTTMKLMEIWTSKVAPFVKRLEIWFSHILPAEQMLVRRFWCFFGWNKCFARDLYQKYQTFPMSELHRIHTAGDGKFILTSLRGSEGFTSWQHAHEPHWFIAMCEDSTRLYPDECHRTMLQWREALGHLCLCHLVSSKQQESKPCATCWRDYYLHSKKIPLHLKKKPFENEIRIGNHHFEGLC